MKYNFDKVIDRYNTASVKWDLCERRFGTKELEHSMWVADMDFEVAEPIKAALKTCVGHGVFGYTFTDDRYVQSVANWFKQRHAWEINKRWVEFSPGVVPAVSMIIQEFAKPGSGIIIQRPIYYPFFDAIEMNGCHIVNNPLKYNGTSYEIDFEDFEAKASQSETSMFILTNPHNPVGRMWSKQDLTRLGDICIKNDILVVSDEIHCDLTFKGAHIPFASINEDFLQNSITCTAPSKTFNIAGLHVSNVIIADQKKRRRFRKAMQRNGLMGPSAFGASACTAAYESGAEWLDQLLDYLQENVNLVKNYFATHLPQVNVIDPEATYLVWLDFRAISTDPEFIEQTLLKKAKVALDNGSIFGEEGNGFARINIACPRSVLENALASIVRGFNG